MLLRNYSHSPMQYSHASAVVGNKIKTISQGHILLRVVSGMSLCQSQKDVTMSSIRACPKELCCHSITRQSHIQQQFGHFGAFVMKKRTASCEQKSSYRGNSCMIILKFHTEHETLEDTSNSCPETWSKFYFQWERFLKQNVSC